MVTMAIYTNQIMVTMAIYTNQLMADAPLPRGRMDGW